MSISTFCNDAPLPRVTHCSKSTSWSTCRGRYFILSSHIIGLSTLNVMLEFFTFHASSDTFMVNVHSSLTLVHDVIAFQLIDRDTLQFLVLLSLHDATKTSHI